MITLPTEDVKVRRRTSTLTVGRVILLITLVIPVNSYFLTHFDLPPQRVQSSPIEAGHPVSKRPPRIPYRDITTDAGITFTHKNGATGEKLMPETMGGGAAFFDYDGDGDQDILFVNSAHWPWDGHSEKAGSVLYENDGTGKFKDVTQQSGLAVSFYGMSVAIGDYDNDDDPDLCFSAVGQNRLFRNDRGKFTEITASAGVGGTSDQWTTAIGWFDFDNDGNLDLWVCRYVAWGREIDLQHQTSEAGAARAYVPPVRFNATCPMLYHNNGDQTFTDVSDLSGICTPNPVGKSLGLTFVDVNCDGWQDVLVANDTAPNSLFLNLQGRKFEDVGHLQGIAFGNDGNARAGMGIDIGKFRANSGDFGIVIGNFANEMTALFVAPEGTSLFTDQAVRAGLGRQTWLPLTFGVLFLDADLDGRLDLFQANGHVDDEVSLLHGNQTYAQPPQLFWNAGKHQPTEFVQLSERECGLDLFQPIVGRAAACADIDDDGDLDLLIGANGMAPRLLRNEQTSGHHWVRVTLHGTTANRDGIGAEVSISAAACKQTRFVNPTRSYFSQCERTVSFGLGAADKIDSMVIRWPGGRVQVIENMEVDRRYFIEEPGR